MIKKGKKKGFIFRVGPTWMRRGTQGHADPRERLRGADVIRVHIYIYS